MTDRRMPPRDKGRRISSQATRGLKDAIKGPLNKDSPKKEEARPAMECYFDPKNASEGECSAEKLSDQSFCHGCKQYICEGHSKNFNMPFGSHPVELHLEVPEDGDES